MFSRVTAEAFEFFETEEPQLMRCVGIAACPAAHCDVTKGPKLARPNVAGFFYACSNSAPRFQASQLRAELTLVSSKGGRADPRASPC